MGRSARRRAQKHAGRFESVGALRGAAALALWPPNADRHVALATLSRSIGVPLTEDDGSRTSDWRAWLSSRHSKDVRDVVPDGLFDAPPIVQSAILGERYALLSGTLNDPDMHLRLWSDALASARATHPHDDALADALGLLLAACAASEGVVEAAALAHGTMWPDHHLEGRIGVPDDETFDRLCAALTVTADARLDPLLRGDDQLPDDRWRFPLVRLSGGDLLLAAPGDLLQAALAHAADLVAPTPTAATVVEHLRAGAHDTLRTVAADQDWIIEAATDTGMVARFDIDKRVAVELVVADLQAPLGSRSPTPFADIAEPLGRLAAARAAREGVVLGLLVAFGDGRGVTWALPGLEAPYGPWPATLAELRLIGDALRRDPLALWRQLQCGPLPPWPDGVELTDLVGAARRAEDHPVSGVDDDGIARPGTEYLHQRGRLFAARHPAPAPDDGRMTTVTRWGGTPDPHIFAREAETHDGSLLVRAPGRYVWIVPPGPVPIPETIEATLVSITAFWVARMLEHGWLFHPEVEELGIAVSVAFADAPGPALAITPAEGGPRVVAGPAFVHAMCRGDNTADRMLVHALSSWWLAPAPAAALVEAVAPAGAGTFTIWPQPHMRLRDPGPEPPPLIPDGIRHRIELEIAASVVAREQIFVLQGADVLDRLDDLIRILLETLDRRISELDASAVLELVRLQERAVAQGEREAITLPARAVMPDAEQLFGEREATPVRGLALRALVERVAARRPEGAEAASLERITDLRARAETLVEWGSARDAVRAGVADVRLIVSPMLGVRLDAEGRGPEAMTAAEDQYVEAAPGRMLEEHHVWWCEEPAPEAELDLDRPIELVNDPWCDVDAAMLEAWGFRWEELLRALRALSNRALDKPDSTAVSPFADVSVMLAEETRIAPERISAILDDLLLRSDKGYDPRERLHKPWGVNRDRSYLRRPLVPLVDGLVAWSALHVLRTARHVSSLCLQNRLRASGRLKRAIGRLSQSEDAAFEREVARRARAAGWQALESRKRLGGMRLERAPGQDIGNLDVLAFRAETGDVLLLEAKRVFPTIVPFGLDHEAAEVAAYADKHEERLAWVREHPERLEREIGSLDDGPWRVAAAIVVDYPLPGAHLADTAVPVWTIDALNSHLT